MSERRAKPQSFTYSLWISPFLCEPLCNLTNHKHNMIFPTQYSMLSTEALKNYLEDTYGLKNISCKLLIHNVSDTYLLAGSDEKYIFKLYRDSHRKLDEIKAEVELLNILKEKSANTKTLSNCFIGFG